MHLVQQMLLKEKNLDSKQKHPVQLKDAMIRAYKFDKSFCLRYIAASENVRQSYTNHTAEIIRKQAASKAHQRLNKRVPNDKLAVHGPPDKTSNFQGGQKPVKAKSIDSLQTKKTKAKMVTHGPPAKSSKCQGHKRPNEINKSHLPQTKKIKVSSACIKSAPDHTLMMKTCKVLYDDGKWYEGTITGCELIEGIWKYKITFSDGESTYASIDHPEVKYPLSH